MDNTFWATVALLVFLAIIIYLKVPAKAQKSLDSRSDEIKAELDEARKLREEAHALLAEYQRKRKEAEQEASEIISAAKAEASLIVDDAAKKTAEHVARRTAMAEQKIIAAQAQAIADVRAAAVDLSVAAAEKIIAGKTKGATADKLIKSAITEVRSRLN